MIEMKVWPCAMKKLRIKQSKWIESGSILDASNIYAD